ARDELAGRLGELEDELVAARADGDRREAAALRLLDDAQTRITELEAARAEARDEAGREAAEREAAERRAGELQAERDAVAVELREAGERAQALADQLAGHLATERELRAEHATAAAALRDLETEVEDARRAASRERAARLAPARRGADRRPALRPGGRGRRGGGHPDDRGRGAHRAPRGRPRRGRPRAGRRRAHRPRAPSRRRVGVRRGRRGAARRR